MRQRIPARRLSWLQDELAAWQAAGLVDPAAAAAIGARYTGDRRWSLGRLLLLLGAGFVGVGLIWLVAANLEEISPVLRFLGITAVWLGCVALAEVLDGGDGHGDGPDEQPGVGAARLVAALAYGGVVFQAAQSLQVPAYEPALLGVWAAGSLGYAYATAGVGVLVVGVSTAVGWFAWVVAERAGDLPATAVGFLVAAAVAAAVAVVHSQRWRPQFAGTWRQAGALLALAGLFLAALPPRDRTEPVLPGIGWLGVGLAVAAGVGAAVLADRLGRIEVLAALGVLAAGVVLLRWSPLPAVPGDPPGPEGVARALVATTAYLLAAGWYAAVGVLRSARHLTGLATAALVVYVTVQSFAVFEPLLSGAALFLVLGVVLLGSGLLAVSGRRRLLADVGGGGP